ncbi:LysR family transcriptional regulator [Shewanella xiamenensis]|uniref:LysR family transcriptional regulator n=2 Tax=Shewanella xiamenensis TaxID=332186 RepID=UPI00069121FA|nr:LysR family transcriptional regulator [Shewanella xiamenensis]MCL1072289.1 LysR family transcriptional regulator [Shewanella xiamenensis]MCR4535904.1 LysR family transcriptional regulator [Shewanella xiamenensis]WHF56515.1 LysR family transcriptional regulator [Shewanella xiamenensis]GGN01135.1 LysR family transcriptional regulator [Shewanella xiamenensis]
MLNQQWLATFVTLVEVGHFTHTANKLFMTQPGVSQHIKKLEEQVGVPLLLRKGKRFELTEAGAMLYQHARQYQHAETELLARIQTDNAHAGECRFGCSGAIASLLYPDFLERQIQYPELCVKIEAAPNQRIVSGILTNQLDMGIVTKRGEEAELTYQALGYAELSLVLPSQYMAEEIGIELLERIGFIDHPDGDYYLQQVLRVNFGGEPKVAALRELRSKAPAIAFTHHIRRTGYVNQLSQILLPVAKGLGFTVLPLSTVNAFTPRQSLWTVDLEQKVQESLYLVHKSTRPLPSRFNAFIEMAARLIGN